MIDFHSHLDDKAFEKDLDLVLDRALKIGVKKIVCPSVGFDSIEKVFNICRNYKFVYPMIGIHPHEAKNIDFNELEAKLTKFIERFKENNIKVIGIGEVGLDYFYDLPFRKEQIELLERELNIAEKLKLPVVLHIRDAFDDILSIIKGFPKIPQFIWHSFSGNLEEARKFLDVGGFLSFSGMITFKNNENLRQVVLKFIPLDKIFLETDAPYLTPEPFRGRRNEPKEVKIIYQKVCELKNVEPESLESIIENNFKNVFQYLLK
jgi:TatD DNase family protein